MHPVGITKFEAVSCHDELKCVKDGRTSVGSAVLASGKVVVNAKEGVSEVNAGIHGNDVAGEETHAGERCARQAIQIFFECERAGEKGWEGLEERLKLAIEPLSKSIECAARDRDNWACSPRSLVNFHECIEVGKWV